MNNSEPRVRQLLTYVREAGREYGEVVGKDIDDDDVAFRAYGDVLEHNVQEILKMLSESETAGWVEGVGVKARETSR